MASVAVASPAQGASSRRDVNANAAAVGTPNSSQSLKSALARSVTGTLAFYFKRPVKLFRPQRISAWTAFEQVAQSQGHKSVSTSFLRGIISKQGWSFFFREAFPPMFANSLIGFTLFSTYTLSESALRYFPSEPVSPYLIPAISGALAGAAQSFISSPLDNVRALLTAHPSASKSVAQEWRGWRHIAFQALFPRWLITSSHPRKEPLRFFANWWRSSWALFSFTLMRDSLGFAVFFSVFELSRTIAKSAGKAVDRWQADLKARSEALGIDIQDLLENEVLGRGWLGRVAQALIIVSFGVLAGLGYGIVGRPFDRARTIVWEGLEDWAKERRRAAKADAEAEKRAIKPGDSVKAVPRASSKATHHAIPSSITHRGRHSRMSMHETRLPLHPPRDAQPPKHPLKQPSIMHPPAYTASRAVPSARAILREKYRKEGTWAMLGFWTSSESALVTRVRAVLSRTQAASNPASQRAKGKKPAVVQSAFESLSEHPALGGTSVFDNLPPAPEPEERRAMPGQHRRTRFWKRIGRPTLSSSATVPLATRSRLTLGKIFRIIPPYCYGFLVYAMVAGDLSD